MAAQKKQLSLDTNVVFDLAEGKDFAHDFREIFQGRGYSLLVPPTTVHELHVLASLIEWGIRPFDLDSVAEAIGEQFVRDLVRQDLIPEAEFNDGLILAETSLEGIPLLVTSDQHLLAIDENALLLAFNEADLFPVHPVHPKRLLQALR
jgi:hypothetical protein